MPKQKLTGLTSNQITNEPTKYISTLIISREHVGSKKPKSHLYLINYLVSRSVGGVFIVSSYYFCLHDKGRCILTHPLIAFLVRCSDSLSLQLSLTIYVCIFFKGDKKFEAYRWF